MQVGGDDDDLSSQAHHITMPWVFPGDNQVIIVTCTLKHM